LCSPIRPTIADAIRLLIETRGAAPNIPARCTRKERVCFSRRRCKARNRIEPFFNKLEQFRRIATRYDKLAASFIAMIKLACVRLWLRGYESTP
jgi:transposase